jgi:hypothetical protein
MANLQRRNSEIGVQQFKDKDGRTGTIVHCDDNWEPCEESKATRARVRYDDGDSAWLVKD